MSRPTIRPFDDGDLGVAGRLLAERHRRHRLRCPLLDPAYEDEDAARADIEALLAQTDASGAVATRDAVVCGFMIGARRDDATWGPNVWVEAAGHAVASAEDTRDLYGYLAGHWVEAGRTAHTALVPAPDVALLDAWCRLGFGHQHVHAVIPTPTRAEIPDDPADVMIRLAEHRDLDELVRLEVLLPAHQATAPVFSMLPVPTLAEAADGYLEELDDPRYVTFVAELDGAVVGVVIGCSINESASNSGLIRPPGAGFLVLAAVFPEARGRGVGRALGHAILRWAAGAGLPAVAIDWRMTNLLASRAWPKLGFRPTFFRLHRRL